jgi:hypothetical protein
MHTLDSRIFIIYASWSLEQYPQFISHPLFYLNYTGKLRVWFNLKVILNGFLKCIS